MTPLHAHNKATWQRLLKHLHWLRVHQQINYKLAVLTYKVRSTGTPSYFSNHIKPRISTHHLPGEPKKNPPLRLLLILQQCMGIFVRNFTRLLSDQIYTLSPSFIEIFLELTKLYSFNHDNPHFTVFVSMFIRMSIQFSLKFEITGRLGRLLPELIADCRQLLPAGFIFQQDGDPGDP